MAASIFHGAPGSFKSASALWYEMLDALREGRLVVTNIEGMVSKDTIEIELNETFPKSADVWFLSTQTQRGMFLWRRWFWWMPVKAFIIMDEVQEIFPPDRAVFKPEELDNEGINALQEHLPAKYYDRYFNELHDFKPDMDEGSSDDTNEVILDSEGNVLYPKTMRDANMRHRKYNWDIIYCTPEITEIHKLVRSVCQYAYAHKYFDSLEFIPWFKRRPRVHEHNPKSTGYPKKKDDPTKWRKVPVEVHKLYKSTSTGKITKRGGVNALKSPSFIIALTLLSICFGYVGWYFLIKDDTSATQKAIAEGYGNDKNVPNDMGQAPINIANTNDNNSNPAQINVSVNLPYNAKQIYFTGHQAVYVNKKLKFRDYFFIMRVGETDISMTNADLKNFGFKVSYINDCLVRIEKGNSAHVVTCPPRNVVKNLTDLSTSSNRNIKE